jgi:hypothetical protein
MRVIHKFNGCAALADGPKSGGASGATRDEAETKALRRSGGGCNHRLGARAGDQTRFEDRPASAVGGIFNPIRYPPHRSGQPGINPMVVSSRPARADARALPPAGSCLSRSGRCANRAGAVPIVFLNHCDRRAVFRRAHQSQPAEAAAR